MLKNSGLRVHNASERERRERSVASLLIQVVVIFCICHLVTLVIILVVKNNEYTIIINIPPQLRLILNVYEGFLAVVHGEVASNWPLW